MARGPLPNDTKRRRNEPTIPTTELPASGPDRPAPECPYDLGGRGRTFWEWAWGLPQACAWDDGALYTVARRAQLEDDMHVLENVGDLADIIGIEGNEAIKQLDWAFGRLKGIASGRNQTMKEMRELDNRLGLNPKGLADLRWKIVPADEERRNQPAPARTASERRARLSVVGE